MEGFINLRSEQQLNSNYYRCVHIKDSQLAHSHNRYHYCLLMQQVTTTPKTITLIIPPGQITQEFTLYLQTGMEMGAECGQMA